MRAAPAVQVHVQRFVAWNGMLMSVGVMAMAACSAWFVARGDDLPAWSEGVIAAAVLIAWVGAWTSLRRHPVRLRWDSRHWYLAQPDRRVDETGPAQVQVMIDAGAWLLLRFVPEGRPSQQLAQWIPVQRSGLEDQWHALRCAVYSARSEGSPSTGLAGPIRIE